MAPRRGFARFMMVMAMMTVRFINLVVPLAQKATAMRSTETAGQCRRASGAVSLMIGASHRQVDVISTTLRFGL